VKCRGNDPQPDTGKDNFGISTPLIPGIPTPTPTVRVDQQLTWDVAEYFGIDSPVKLPKATSTGDGVITYAVVDPGTAECALGGDQGRRLTFTRVPGQVRDLRVTALDAEDGVVTLRWRVPSDTGTHPILRYRVRIREVNETDYRVVGYTLPNVLTKTVTDIEPGRYYLRVRAANAAGSGKGFVVGPVTITG
jgi:hypothetical protein